MISNTRKKQTQYRTTQDTTRSVLIFEVEANKTAEIYVDIFAVKNDRSSQASFELSGLFYRVGSGNVTQEGDTSKVTMGDLAVDVNFNVNTTDQTVEVQIQGVSSEIVHWQLSGTIRQREDIEDYTGDPRLQITIIGMRYAKKNGWQGFSDGINYVLNPSEYSTYEKLTGTEWVQKETWVCTSAKTIGTEAVSDCIQLSANRTGNSSSWTRNNSRAFFQWCTGTGDWGSGEVDSLVSVRTFTTNVNGFLKNRILCGCVNLSPLPITILWSKYDATLWENYQILLE